MKCNMDCEHCTRPVSKCKGGTYRTAYADAAEKAVNELLDRVPGLRILYGIRKHMKGSDE